MILTVGRWVSRFVPSLARLIALERQVVAWFEPLVPSLFEPERFPVFNAEVDGESFSGCPSSHASGFKYTKIHHLGQIEQPEDCVRDYDARDEQVIRTSMKKFFPSAAGRTLNLDVCWFDNSPDRDFIIDRLPECENTFVATGFSGFGFKFTPSIAQLLAQWVESGSRPAEASPFRLDRLAPAVRR